MADLLRLIRELSNLTAIEAAELVGRLGVKLMKMPNDSAQRDVSPEIYFVDQFAALKKETELALRISGAIGGKFTSERVGWSQWMHLRLCISADSLIRLASVEDRIKNGEVCTLDQSTIATIARGMIEATAMIAYMADQSLTDSDWKLRRLVIHLHDATTRHKMFKGWNSLTESNAYREEIVRLRSEIETVPEFKSLPEERQHKIRSGQEFYLKGLRSAIRLMGWDIDEFDSTYAYLSSYTHSSPVRAFSG